MGATAVYACRILARSGGGAGDPMAGAEAMTSPVRTRRRREVAALTQEVIAGVSVQRPAKTEPGVTGDDLEWMNSWHPANRESRRQQRSGVAS